ncbi:hypothetical protein AVEN_192834-1 [Araneus ventricosus]|uniref:Uncharacterized protein n=1 Tax=Araneus ventricosus TaxID=182803 RepID=A0A4Y2QAR4_ARAVE|nr:hypothetical protein AVEN_91442-1 [Araneus ventricosus]GBN60698.1 hypothetical protein AVEN_192834-1 [Araneus ventricosus]
MIDKIDPEVFADGLGALVIDWFKDLEKFSSETIRAGLHYGKTLRNILVESHFKKLLPIFDIASAKIRERDAEVYDLKGLITDSDPALDKAKIRWLESENESLRAKLEGYQDLSSTVREIIPALE